MSAKDDLTAALFHLHEVAMDASNDISKQTLSDVQDAIKKVKAAIPAYHYEHTKQLIEQEKAKGNVAQRTYAKD